jgi:hypothetical protein
MGHSSIQITVDTYGHLIPGAELAGGGPAGFENNSAPISTRDKVTRKSERVEVAENTWLPPRDSNPDNLLQRQVS